MTTTQKTKNLLGKESKKFADKNLNNVFRILNKHGLLLKSEYTFPLKDTIGKIYFDKRKITNFE